MCNSSIGAATSLITNNVPFIFSVDQSEVYITSGQLMHDDIKATVHLLSDTELVYASWACSSPVLVRSNPRSCWGLR